MIATHLARMLTHLYLKGTVMSRWLFSLVALAAMSLSVSAQEIRLNPPHFALLINEAVVKELKLTAEQQEQLKAVLGDFIQEVNGQKRIVIQGGTDIESLEADSLKVLNEKQSKRLREAWIQVNGAMGITDAKLAKRVLRVYLKYGATGERVIQRIRRVSTPGCRIYRSYKDLKPVLDGLGISLLSTNKGVKSDRQARKEKLGGEVICEVW